MDRGEPARPGGPAGRAWSRRLLVGELSEDPGDPVAHLVRTAAEHLATQQDIRAFATTYLIVHGLLKLGLAVALLKRIRPVYPVAVVVLAASIGYTMYRFAHTGAPTLPGLAALDLVILGLVLLEYRRLRR